MKTPKPYVFYAEQFDIIFLASKIDTAFSHLDCYGKDSFVNTINLVELVADKLRYNKKFTLKIVELGPL